LKSNEWLTAKDIADKIDSTKRHVLKTLKKLRDRGVVDCRKGEGAYGADLYRAITGRTTTHLTELGPSLSRDCEMDGSMWALVVRDADAVPQDAEYESPEPDELTPTLSSRFAPPPPDSSCGREDTESSGTWEVNWGESA
jgi:hypothetical protein